MFGAAFVAPSGFAGTRKRLFHGHHILPNAVDDTVSLGAAPTMSLIVVLQRLGTSSAPSSSKASLVSAKRKSQGSLRDARPETDPSSVLRRSRRIVGSHEWNYPRQMVEIRRLASGVQDRDKISKSIFSMSSRSIGPCRRLQDQEGGALVLLIDELDRTDEPFEAFLLEVLSDRTIPELGTIKAKVLRS